MMHDVSVGDNSIADANERTLYITFPRGVPMSQEEVIKQCFTEQYGENCVQGIDMQHDDGQEQALFAKLVLDSVATMNRVLNHWETVKLWSLSENDSVKLRINGKVFWARKHTR
ncbi:hypothetical protein ISN44_As05g022820 [Arabidopsis suecica]|uniref:RRM domain-containing protein n=2 Tax=Arabidopsis TaxID=3701 RepID=Q3E970_ARATH|nr:uncharacterized protein AT5G24355 [Arabidopsis thaliana]AED93300.1 hypothetical protein AT5G24355 [Arabidopsis thaliana]KAG7610260.1 hypothetical protein ISN44_As05g022820 [Arabidopsis suecica]|eukprot:NP_680216.1 hypothetical protein AT5G24355 [Arabidopsis thaliana]